MSQFSSLQFFEIYLDNLKGASVTRLLAPDTEVFASQ